MASAKCLQGLGFLETTNVEVKDLDNYLVEEMDENLWAQMPGHLVETVLTWLPVASILRSKSVSRSWYSFINSEPFLNSYAEASNLRRQEPWFLAFPKEMQGLAYDPLENRWITLPFDFLPRECRPVAAAEGVMCMIPKSGNTKSLYICNPISKQWKELPRPFDLFRFLFLVAALMVDRKTGFFNLILARSELVTGAIDQFVLTAEVYNSATRGWNRNRSFLVDSPLHPWKAVCNGVLYCVIGISDWNIIGFDIFQGYWFRVRAPMPPLLTTVKLMDHNGKLLLIAGIGDSNVTQEITMWELNSEKTEWIRMGGIPRKFCDEFLKSQTRKFACVGHGDFIYFTSKKCPNILVYNLSHHTCYRIACCQELADPYLQIFNSFCFLPTL